MYLYHGTDTKFDYFELEALKKNRLNLAVDYTSVLVKNMRNLLVNGRPVTDVADTIYKTGKAIYIRLILSTEN